MSTSTRLTWLSALAVLLSASSLHRVYDEDLGWFLPVTGAVLAVALAGLLARRLRVPVLLQPAAGLLATALFAAVVHASDTFLYGLLPTRSTAAVLATRVGEGLLDVETLSPPVPTTPGLVLLALLGAGAVASVVDLLAVGLRRPALAGLPLLTLLVLPAATLEGGVGGMPFALGAAGWLALLMAESGERVGRWGAALRAGGPPRGATHDEGADVGRVGRRIGVAALGTALVVPVLLPGLEGSLLSGSGLGGTGARSTTTYNPLTELAGQLRLPEPRELLRYSTTDPEPDYLRLTTLDRFDDDVGWSSSGLSADRRTDAVSRGIPTPAGSSAADVQPLTSVIRVQGLGGPWLPVPPVPVEIEVEGPWLWEDISQTVFSIRTDLEQLQAVYRVTAERVLPSVERLRRGGVVPDEVEALAAPPEVSADVRDLTAAVVADAGTPYEQAAALQAFFREGNGFRYSEDASLDDDDANALEAFLRRREGFCEQYASAMAAMTRVLGLPSRVAVGFVPGTRLGDGTFQVTTDDAHAWPEVWFAGHGWVRFEPTPRDDRVITPGYTTAPAPETAPDLAGPDAPDPAAAPALPQDPAAANRERLLRGDEPLTAPSTPVESGSRLLLALVVAPALLVLVVPGAVAAVRRRRRWSAPGPHAAWAQVVEDAVDVGHRWRPADSPRAAAADLAGRRGLVGQPLDALRRVAAQVERARYARPAVDGVADAAALAVPAASPELHDDVAAVRRGLLASAGIRTRWVARLAPPSTLRWMWHGSGAAVADVLDRADALIASTASSLRRALPRA